MSIKTRFHLVNESGADLKTSVIKVKLIEDTENEETYLFPPDLQPLSRHPELAALPIIKTALKALTKRNQFRNIKVTLTKEIAEKYFDEEGNVRFGDNYLEEYTSDCETTVTRTEKKKESGSTSETIQQIRKPIHSIAKDMVITKFTGRNQNAESWLQIFERECNRLELQKCRYPECLRLFLDGPGEEWFTLNQKDMSLNDSWEGWKMALIEAFGDRGWTDIDYAFSFKYINGPLNEYVLKKLNLLLEAEPTISIKSRIFLVALGLPPFIRNRLHHKKINTQNDLISEINLLESLVKPKSSKFQNSIEKNKTVNTSKNYKPCTICEKLGFLNRYHPENTCWNKKNMNVNVKLTGKNENQNIRNIKIANNTQLEKELNDDNDQKN